MHESERWVPEPTPETTHFWAGTRVGELRLQRCVDCGHVYFPPRAFCSHCLSRSVSVFAATGRATLLSYVISHRPAPGYEPPYSIAIIELEEGPRMLSNIIGCEQTPDALHLDMPLEVAFIPLSEEIVLPQFKPAKESP